MKKTITIIVLLALAVNIFSQEPIKDKDYYLAKSKSQKSVATGLLIGGGVLIGVGLLIGNQNESSFDDAATGAIIGGIGVLSMIGSIPLFIASGKNKRKASLVINSGSIQLNPLSKTNKRLVTVGIAVTL